jgi:hypothetical protein
MNKVIRTVTILVGLCLTVSFPTLAVGPIDGEVSALYWANTYETSSLGPSTSSDAGAPGLKAQLWMLERYGLTASRYGSDADGPQGADYTSVDLMWRALSPTENNYVAVGLGWQQMDLSGLSASTSGVRLGVEGSIGIVKVLKAYGHGSYLPALDDVPVANPSLSDLHDVDAFEYELGLAWTATPFLNVHAGYRVNSVSFSQVDLLTTSSVGDSGGPDPQGSGGGIAKIAPGVDDGDCPDCPPLAATSGGQPGETESAGFYVGLGFTF